MSQRGRNSCYRVEERFAKNNLIITRFIKFADSRFLVVPLLAVERAEAENILTHLQGAIHMGYTLDKPKIFKDFIKNTIAHIKAI